jgi:hypothetical protein
MRMQGTAERQQTGTLARDGPILRVVRPAGRFVAEALAMCAVMCMGAFILGFAFFEGAARLGYPSLVPQAPELAIVIIAIFYALAMAVYMRLRGHGLGHNLEMSGVTVAVGVVLAIAYWLGAIPQSSVKGWYTLLPLMCFPVCLPMVVLMVLHRDMYTGRAGHHGHAH